MRGLFVMLAMALGFNAYSSHLLGGYIQTVQRGFSDTVDVKVTLFTDPQGIPNPATITLQEYELINGSYQLNASFSVIQQSATTWQGVNAYVYTGVRVLSAGDYRFVYTNCCRGVLVNSSSSMNSNFTIGLDYKKTSPGTIPNSAPVILNPLPINWVVNDTAQSILFTMDPDGDSVVVEMDDAINQYNNGVFDPMMFTQLNNYGYYQVDQSGQIIWAPNTSGIFATGYKVSEYRNGMLIGENRLQQVYITQPGIAPVVSNFSQNIVIDLVNGDSITLSPSISNALSTSLIIPGIENITSAASSWSLNDLQVGTYTGVLRATNNASNLDYFISVVVTSTIGIEENVMNSSQEFKVYDWYGNYRGKSLDGLKGLYILMFENKTEKVFIK